MKVGDIVLVKVTGISQYGFFIEKDQFVGLCHISEVSYNFVEDINDFVSVGENVYVLILDVDEKNKQLKVSIKDINYKNYEDKNRIRETRKGFLPLKEMLPVWIDEKVKEYNIN